MGNHMEYTLDELARAGGSKCECLNACGKAVNNESDVRAKFVIHGEIVEGLGKIEKARVRVKLFRVAQSSSESKTDSISACFGNGIQLVVCKCQGKPHEWTVGELAYVLKYLRKAVAQA